MKNNYVFQNKMKLVRGMALCYILQLSLMFGLIEDGWILISIFVFKLFLYVVFV